MPKDFLNDILKYENTSVPWKERYTKTMSPAPRELATLCCWVEFMNIQKYLEIGVAGGGLMHFFINQMGIDAYGIDQGPPLMVDKELVFVGNSHSNEAHKWAKSKAPFDMVYIDADHTYESVFKDFEMYGSLSTKMVVFHDTVHQRVHGVRKFFDELKGKKLEIIEHGYGKGTGILFLEGA